MAHSGDPQAPVLPDAWTAGLAHDLRQPLSAIQNAVCLLRLTLDCDPRISAQLSLIEDQVDAAEAAPTPALAWLRANPAQPTGAADGNFDFTNAAAAAVR